MKLLRIDSSILGQNSASRELSKRVVERLMEADSSIELIYRDLSRDHLPHLGLGALPGTHPLAAAAGALDDTMHAQRAVSTRRLRLRRYRGAYGHRRRGPRCERLAEGGRHRIGPGVG